jgi:hypothetical protein
MGLIARRATGAVVLLCLLFATSSARAACPRDCNGDGAVTVGELITGVNIALGSEPVTACPAFDANNNHMVEVSELIAAVNAALSGCPAAPSPTPTIVIEPIFPANYRDTFTEVRDCRLGLEHGGELIRVLANSIAAQPYLNNQNPLLQGSIVVKEEYDLNATDCSDPAKIVSWSAMRKEMPGFDPVDRDWHWQRVPAPGSSVRACASKDDCPNFTCTSSGCHRLPECLARDYMCTADTTPRGTLHPVLQNLPAAVLSVSGTSSSDVYAVGADARDGHGPYVIHYDGSTWKRLDTGVTSRPVVDQRDANRWRLLHGWRQRCDPAIRLVERTVHPPDDAGHVAVVRHLGHRGQQPVGCRRRCAEPGRRVALRRKHLDGAGRLRGAPDR